MLVFISSYPSEGILEEFCRWTVISPVNNNHFLFYFPVILSAVSGFCSEIFQIMLKKIDDNGYWCLILILIEIQHFTFKQDVCKYMVSYLT